MDTRQHEMVELLEREWQQGSQNAIGMDHFLAHYAPVTPRPVFDALSGYRFLTPPQRAYVLTYAINFLKGDPAAVTSPPPRFAPPAFRPRRRGVSPLGWVGIAFAALFTALIVTVGVVETARGDRVESVQFAKSDNGTKPVDITTTFNAADPAINCFVKVTSSTLKVKIVWSYVDVVDASRRRRTDEQIAVQQLSGNTTYEFTESRPAGSAWPVGRYKVDIYLGEQLKQTAEFTVVA